MPRTHAPYPPEFRREAIRLARSSGKPLTHIAQQLEISHETLRAWIKQADIDEGLRHDGLTTEETEEVRRLRREVKRLREEREILYTSITFGSRCREVGVVPSLGSRGDCYDIAITESFCTTLECELLDRSVFRTRTQARTAIFDDIEGFYNTHRRHSALRYLSPAAFERQSREETAA